MATKKILGQRNSKVPPAPTASSTFHSVSLSYNVMFFLKKSIVVSSRVVQMKMTTRLRSLLPLATMAPNDDLGCHLLPSMLTTLMNKPRSPPPCNHGMQRRPPLPSPPIDVDEVDEQAQESPSPPPCRHSTQRSSTRPSSPQAGSKCQHNTADEEQNGSDVEDVNVQVSKALKVSQRNA